MFDVANHPTEPPYRSSGVLEPGPVDALPLIEWSSLTVIEVEWRELVKR
jgi:hypothetical protein